MRRLRCLSAKVFMLHYRVKPYFADDGGLDPQPSFPGRTDFQSAPDPIRFTIQKNGSMKFDPFVLIAFMASVLVGSRVPTRT